jgi:hypothetical protein
MAGKAGLFLAQRVVVAQQIPSGPNQGRWELRNWTLNALDGSFAFGGSTLQGSGSLFSVTRVPGYGMRQMFATALRGSGTQVLRVVVHAVRGDGSFVELANIETSYPLGSDGQVRIGSYDAQGVLVATKERQGSVMTTLAVWSADLDDTQDVDLNFVVDETTTSESLLGLCRVPDDRAEGDFLIAQRDLFTGELRLGAWRSGRRLACGLIGIEPLLVLVGLTLVRRSRAASRAASARSLRGRAARSSY